MTYLIFALAFVAYAVHAYISYSLPLADNKLPYYLGAILAGVAGGILWILLAKMTPNPNKIAIYGTIWQVIVVSGFFLVGFTMFGVKLTPRELLAITLMLTGSFLL